MNTFAEQVSAESVLRLLPSLKPLAWQSLSAPTLQFGAPFVETGHIMRPATIELGLARRDSVSPASFAPAFRSPMVSLGLFRGGKIDKDFSKNFPISLNRPGFSSRAAGASDGAGSLCRGAVCWPGSWASSEGGCAACGQAAPAAIINVSNAAPAVATCILDNAIRLPGRSNMISSLA